MEMSTYACLTTSSLALGCDEVAIRSALVGSATCAQRQSAFGSCHGFSPCNAHMIASEHQPHIDHQDHAHDQLHDYEHHASEQYLNIN